MYLLAFGINHKTAPLEVRERTLIAPEDMLDALRDITTSGTAAEATILSTCNRTELYCGLERDDGGSAIRWFSENYRLVWTDIEPYLYKHRGADAVRHAFRVASGLDSMVLGEPQILGQMKEAFATALRAGATGKVLNRLFQHTFSVAKQVRTDTAIGASAVSVAYAAVSLAKQIFARLSEQTVLLNGAGDMIELCARHLREQGVTRMIVANRTLERARLLAEPLGAIPIPLAEMPLRLSEADIVISSTASQLPILGKGAVESALKLRKHRPIFMVDIAVPRDIESEVADLNDVYLYTIDDLKDVVQENLESRLQAAREAEKIIDIQVASFMRWVKSLEAVPKIRALRATAYAVRQTELERARRMLARGQNPEEVLARLAHSLTNKLLHAPTTTLRDADQEEKEALSDAIDKLFKLSEDNDV
ncbi:MAG: glutamyl-tRNA reductase [Acidiferrobacterales bacterium]